MQRPSLLALSAICLSFLLLHLLNPDVSFDTPSLILLFLAILPWLTPLFRELDIPGIGKFVFQDGKKKVPAAPKKRRKRKKKSSIEIIVGERRR